MKFTVFQSAQTAKELIQRFVEEFFQDNAGMAVQIPEIKGFRWTQDPESRLLSISEAFEGHMNQAGDGLPDRKFPLVLITYPDFSQIDTGIGSVINKQDSYYESGPESPGFLYHDKFNNWNVELSYRTEEERLWQILRYHYGFSFAIDIVSNSVESRERLADLVRVMMDQYLAFLSPRRNLSSAFMLTAYQYETEHSTKVSLSMPEHQILRYYPAFFPYGEIAISFDTPLAQGSGDYDNMELFGEENLFTSSFTIEGMRLEAFHYVEQLGFLTASKTTIQAIKVDETGLPYSEMLAPQEIIQMIRDGELTPEQYEQLKQDGKIPPGFCGGSDPFRSIGVTSVI